MRYAEHLKRSMNRLSTDTWEQLLTADPADRPTPKTVLAICPCCRTTVAVELTVTLLPVVNTPAPAADPDDILSPGISDDTQIELAALTCTDLVAV